MLVLERLVGGVVQVAVIDFVGDHAGKGQGQLVELAPEVLALLMSALSGGGQGGKFGVDLQEQLAEFTEIQGPAFVLVVLLEQPVQTTEVVGGLRKPFLDTLGDFAPFRKGDGHVLGVFTFFVRDGSKEVHQMVGNVVLHCRTITNGVDGS